MIQGSFLNSFQTVTFILGCSKVATRFEDVEGAGRDDVDELDHEEDTSI